MLDSQRSHIGAIHQSKKLFPNTTRSVVEAWQYNPIESIVGEMPISLYETLAILSEFRPLTCSNIISSEYFVSFDLDPTPGYTMAMQGRYPNSLTYTPGKRLDDEYSIIGTTSIDYTTTNPIDCSAKCKLETFGADIAYCVQSDRDVKCCLSALRTNGTLLIRCHDPHYFNAAFISEWFKELILYKPAVTSCISTESYLVCLGRRSTWAPSNLKFDEEVSKLDLYKLGAIDAISKGVTNQAKLNAVKNYYLGID